jgi:hypothetical protein
MPAAMIEVQAASLSRRFPSLTLHADSHNLALPYSTGQFQNTNL